MMIGAGNLKPRAGLLQNGASVTSRRQTYFEPVVPNFGFGEH
jgi:hypothetical protein